MMILRPEQRTTVDKVKQILKNYNVAYLAAEVRTGKTFMAITTACEIGWKSVLIITKKKAIGSIQKDIMAAKYPVHFDVTNFEQVKNIKNKNYDGFIIDEAHSLGAYPKTTNRTQDLKELIGNKPVLLMSGTPTPESYSQIFHQFWVTIYGPFQKYKTFYKWAHDFIQKKEIEIDVRNDEGMKIGKEKKYIFHIKYINGIEFNDYSKTKTEEIQNTIRPYMVNLSQQEAGFMSLVEEEIIRVPIDQRLYKLMDVLKKDKVYKMKCGDYIVCDTPAKMQSAFHQISSGTIKIDAKVSHILDESKAWYVKTKYAGYKLAIFYKFIKEGDLLRKIFTNHTADPEEFNSSPDKIFICQIVSGREGTNLSTADLLIMYNIDFSATSYWQGRARMQTKDRASSKMIWLFSEQGIETKVYKAVVQKKSYTTSHFKRDYGIK